MTKDLAEAIVALDAERVMTNVYLISAECENTGLNLRRFVEAENATQAEELWLREMGYYDADPRYAIYRKYVTIHEIPTPTGHPGVLQTESAL